MTALDVGAGTGTLAALAVEAGAAVTAVDPDPEMVAMSAATVTDARILQAGLPELPFRAGAFDAVFANFVVNHLPDPRAGVCELARVTASAGRVVVTIWPSGESVQAKLWADMLVAADVVVPPGHRLPREKDFPRSAEGLATLMQDAALGDVVAEAVRWTHRADPELFWEGAEAGVGGIGATVSSQPPEVRERLKAEYDRLVRPFLEAGQLVLPTEAILAVGVK